MNLYVAGPMTGLPEFNYPAFFAASERLEAAGFKTLNPARDEGRDGCTEWLHFMRASLRDIADCDGIATLPDWESSRGARLEVDLAQQLGLPVMPVEAWLATTKAGTP